MNRTIAKRMWLSAGAYGGFPVPRLWMWRRAQNRCFYCGTIPTKDQRTIDHLTPIHRGGTTEEDNLVPSCRSCNRTKGWRTLDEYRALIGVGHLFWGELEKERRRE